MLHGYEKNFIDSLDNFVKEYSQYISTQQSKSGFIAGLSAARGRNTGPLVELIQTLERKINTCLKGEYEIEEVITTLLGVFKKVKKGDKVLGKSIDGFLDESAKILLAYQAKQKEELGRAASELEAEKKKYEAEAKEVKYYEEENRRLQAKLSGFEKGKDELDSLRKRSMSDKDRIVELEKIILKQEGQLSISRTEYSALESKYSQAKDMLAAKKDISDLFEMAVLEKRQAMDKLCMLNQFMIPFSMQGEYKVETMEISMFRRVIAHYQRQRSIMPVPESEFPQQGASARHALSMGASVTHFVSTDASKASSYDAHYADSASASRRRRVEPSETIRRNDSRIFSYDAHKETMREENASQQEKFQNTHQN